MPLFIPFLIGGALVSHAKASDGRSDLKKAAQIGQEAHARHQRVAEQLKTARRRTDKRAQRYAREQAIAVDRVLRPWVAFINAMKRRGKLRKVSVVEGVSVSPADLDGYRECVLKAELLLDPVDGLKKGVALGAGTASLVGLFGTASTGAAISGLAGAAAQNATLAYLGGGSLAAGGLGVAGGMAVMGGLVAAPAVIIASFRLAEEGQKALTSATEYAAKADKQIERMKTSSEFLSRLRVRLDELENVLTRLVERAADPLAALDASTFDENSDRDIRLFQRAGILVSAVSDLVRTPVLDSDLELHPAGADIQVRMRTLLETP